MKIIRCDKCNKKIDAAKDIVTISEVGFGIDRRYLVLGKYGKNEVGVKISIKGLFDFDEDCEPIHEDVCIDCFYEIIKEIINNKTEIEWTRSD